jgi:hypothetical protein
VLKVRETSNMEDISNPTDSKKRLSRRGRKRNELKGLETPTAPSLHGTGWDQLPKGHDAIAGRIGDLEQLIMAIGEYIDGHNQNPKPFIGPQKQKTNWKRSLALKRSSINENLQGGLH